MTYRFLEYIYYPSSTYAHAVLPGLPPSGTLRDEAVYRARHMVKVLRHIRSGIGDMRRPNPVTDAKESDVLKIFMAPEFYFRSSQGTPDGAGHYSLFDVQEARQVIRTAVLNDKRFDDWLVVPGTAVYAQQRANPAKQRVIFNEAWAFARPTGTNPKIDVCCQKRYFSDEDKLDGTKAALAGGGALARLARHVDHQIVTVGGVDVGFEVCLDHRETALKNTVTGGRPVNPRNVDVHLLSSCGMETLPDSIAARSNGYFLRCNGNDWALPRVEAFQVGVWPVNGRPNASVAPPLNDLGAHLQFFLLPADLQIHGGAGVDEVGLSAQFGLR